MNICTVHKVVCAAMNVLVRLRQKQQNKPTALTSCAWRPGDSSSLEEELQGSFLSMSAIKSLFIKLKNF